MALSPGAAVLYQTHHSTFKALGADLNRRGGAHTLVNDGDLVLLPAPTNGLDAIDGSILVRGRPTRGRLNLQFSNSVSPSDATGLFNVDGDPLALSRAITNGIDPGVDGIITVRSSSAVIPEPSSMVLAGLGIAGVADMALRRRIP
jgi:hypothetical protein